MIYKTFQGERLSALGFGAMRLPVVNDKYFDVDQDKVNEMVDYAMAHGVNYFDTAWGYHDGNSEIALSNALNRYQRNLYHLADKFPGYDLSNMDKVEEIFEKQLGKCKTDYFDFYLFHNVCEMNIDGYLDRSHRIFDYLTAQKRNGRIKHLGFSSHGDLNNMRRFFNAYGSKMEFCQIQLNYLDWDFQQAKEKVDLIKGYGIPVWVMEPLRGGKLAVLKDEYAQKLKALRPNETIPAWAFRFVQGLPEVGVTLSGMSSFEQLKANIETFETEQPLNEAETATLLGIAKDMVSETSLPCTACRYCTSKCPKGLDIPSLISIYNEHRFTGGGFLAPMLLDTYAEDKRPSACIGCHSCEKVCPQQLKISEAMADFTQMLKDAPEL